MTAHNLSAAVRQIRKAVAGPAAGPTDAALLQAYLSSSDEEAFESLVRRYQGLVAGVCRRVLGNLHDAEDATQATFLVLARKAGSIGNREALASWLHGAAHRIALQARRDALRRRARDGRGTPVRSADPADELTWREVQEALDEEVQRLPTTYRSAFVLCCLDGLTYAEAGSRLAVSEGAVSSRVTRARQRLHERLARRGVMLSAVLASVAVASAARAGSPAAIAGAVLSHVQGKSGLPATILSLAEGATKTMLGNRSTLAAVLLLAAGLTTAALAGLTRQPARATPPTKAFALADEKGKAPPPREVGDEQTIEITGRVLDPEGKPFTGADVGLGTDRKPDKEEKPVRTMTDADGTFRLTARETDLERGIKVVASAKGLGPDWVDVKPGAKKIEVNLKLVKDDVPIEGRVLDLEGNPVAGVTVRVTWMQKRVDEADLGPWIETWKAMQRRAVPQGILMSGLWPGAAGLTTSATTDKAGRFRLTGFGRERVAHATIEGAEIETQRIMLMTRAGVGKVDVEFPHLYGAKSTHLSRPSKPITGTVRDKRTGKPLAGITVGADATPGGMIGRHSYQRTVTDEEGKYRIVGVGKHELYSVSAEATPYFNVTRWGVKDTPGLEPIVVDFELERGLTVRGKLTDRATGKPVRGSVFWRALPDNPNLKDYATLAPNTPKVLVGRGGITNDDGSFVLTAIAGPGLLLVEATDAQRYRRSADADDEALIRDAAKVGANPSHQHAIVRVNPSEKELKSLVCDVALDPGVTRSGTVLDPDGKPLEGALAGGLDSLARFGAPPKLKTADFKVHGLSPDRPRAVLFYHPEKKLSKLVWVKGDEKGPIEVRLEALGATTGRVLDENGKPLARAGLILDLNRNVVANKDLPHEFLASDSPLRAPKDAVTTDGEGRFKVEGLVPGARYDVFVQGVGFIRGVTVKSSDKGAEMGDVKLKPLTNEEKE